MDYHAVCHSILITAVVVLEQTQIRFLHPAHYSSCIWTKLIGRIPQAVLCLVIPIACVVYFILRVLDEKHILRWEACLVAADTLGTRRASYTDSCHEVWAGAICLVAARFVVRHSK